MEDYCNFHPLSHQRERERERDNWINGDPMESSPSHLWPPSGLSEDCTGMVVPYLSVPSGLSEDRTGMGAPYLLVPSGLSENRTSTGAVEHCTTWHLL